MIRYVLKRILFLIPVILAVAVTIFIIMDMVPGDPAQMILGAGASTADVEALRETMGLNDPFLIRLGRFLNMLFLHGSFGNSYNRGTDVMNDLFTRLPNTMRIALFSILISVGIGLPIGVRAAVKANTWEDRLSMFVTMIGISIPNFWLGILLALLFALKLKWLPSSGSATWKHFILPVFTSGLAGIAGIARQSRSSMLEVIRSDFVATARAKGVSERSAIYHHALPNAMIPIITAIGGGAAAAMGGTVVIETVFSIPGMGLYLSDGITNRDYNSVQGSVIMYAVTFSIVMLVVDIIYALVDPRIKSQYVNSVKQKKKPEEKEDA